MKVALLCGGPSPERGISLNSARTVLDHLDGDGVEIVPVYFDQNKKAYLLSKPWIYSNTPLDFDFKLAGTTEPLSDDELVKELKKIDMVFPAMHGSFGEDGEIQSFLESNGIPFIGASSKTCRLAFDKYHANNYIRDKGFFAPNSIDISVKDKRSERIEKIKDFFIRESLERVIVKPAQGGSSIGVFSVNTPKEAEEKAEYLFSAEIDSRVVVEPFAEGREFTAIVVENRFAEPVCILPTEIETDHTENNLFDFRKKYLPTRQVSHYCPPRFNDETIEEIQEKAEQLFSLFGFKDVARFDGWVFPDGRLWFSDFNPVSGMEQNSFLFQQSSRVGFSHRDFLMFILKNSCKKQGVATKDIDDQENEDKKTKKKRVNVIFGGKTSEKQVSLMSGTNVWLKLRNSKDYDPYPYLLDTKGRVWCLPYAYTLNHTVEEIMENCEMAEEDQKRLSGLEKRVLEKLSASEKDRSEKMFIPRSVGVKDLIKNSDYVFLGLHGGDGEDGTLQLEMEERRVCFNGSGSVVSQICMDKWKTGEMIKNMNIEGLDSTIGEMVELKDLYKRHEEKGDRAIISIWERVCQSLNSDTFLVKPRSDGCSTGIVKLTSLSDFKKYIGYLKKGTEFIPSGVFAEQEDIVHMPGGNVNHLIFENFVKTDKIGVEDGILSHHRKDGWVEITMGVLERDGVLRSLNPSITVAEGAVLTVEEKFQGGTGVNLTPPPSEIVGEGAIQRARDLVEKAVNGLGIKGYARVDAFMHIDSGSLKVIEINTLPALTPSTVLFHQALSEDAPIYPLELLEKVIKSSGY
ncbi:MAG: ATP-grasp domain-containing protein [Candidatus Paceibacterota bacterium]